MTKLLTVDADFTSYTVGSKASRLQELKVAGYPVPNFVVLSGECIQDIHATTFASEVVECVPAQLYAVRSAALAEDSVLSSQAGQFLTRLAVEPRNLFLAVQEVLTDAQSKLSDVPSSFSIIIQEYIEPDYAGVLFTRNPTGGREMVLEYTAGRGDEVVAGKSVQSVHIFESTLQLFSSKLPFARDLCSQAKMIERTYNFPQDIEWAYQGGRAYILQTRPITTLTQAQFSTYQCLEKWLPDTAFYFEQTAVTESLSRPTPLALSTLNYLYRQPGPIASVYAEQGITYKSLEQFVVLGNQLYVDKQRETKTLFPAYGFLRWQSNCAKVESLAGLWTSLRNKVALTRLSADIRKVAYQSVITMLQSDVDKNASMEYLLEQLDIGYKLIFDINLRASLAHARFEAMAGSAEKAQAMIAATTSSLEIPVDIKTIATNLQGNSVSIDDTSAFTAQTNVSPLASKTERMSLVDQALVPKARAANDWLLLRELGRWLTVKLISDIRTAAHSKAATQAIEPTSLVLHATVPELCSGLPTQLVLQQRKMIYDSFHDYTFPGVLASYELGATDVPHAVLSPGSAQGMLCRPEQCHTISGPKILLVSQLTPELTKYFPHIEGIVCATGGLLSHLAIMARESQLMVVRDSSVEAFVGQQITIGTDGVIERRNSKNH